MARGGGDGDRVVRIRESRNSYSSCGIFSPVLSICTPLSAGKMRYLKQAVPDMLNAELGDTGSLRLLVWMAPAGLGPGRESGPW